MKTIFCFATCCETYQVWTSEDIPDGEVQKVILSAYLACKVCGTRVKNFEWKAVKETAHDAAKECRT